jgi:cell division protein FtsQ
LINNNKNKATKLNNVDNNLYDINNIEYFKNQSQQMQFKRRRLRNFRIILIIILFALVIYLITPFSKINSITIINNDRFTQSEIEDQINLHQNDFSLLHPKFLIKMQLANTNYYQEFSVDKSLLGNVTISVKENRLLFYQIDGKNTVFYDEKGNKIIMKDSVLKKYIGNYPQLTSKISEDMLKRLISSLAQLDSSVVSSMSQIVYDPKNYDKEYFKIIMNGPKKIYLYSSLDYLVKVGTNYHNFAANAQYSCNIIQYIDDSNKAVITKCK